MSRPAPFSAKSMVPGTVYRVEQVIGSGGMGSVYAVEHVELGKRFVLKVLHSHLAARRDLVSRMRNEWRALAKLNHQNIVQVTDAGTTGTGLPYYVMEHLEGMTLAQLLAEKGRLPLRRAATILSDVLSGLSAAHATGAIHRDIKPQNIFVEASGRTKLLDFGIAKLRDQVSRVVTAGGVSIGTPRFMAPEQAEGTVVDGRADIYSSALVLYEALVGKGPFAHIKDPNELVLAHMSVEPERADFVSSSVPPQMGDLLQRWLSKSPKSRPLSAEVARLELDALVAGLPADFEPTEAEVTHVGVAYDAATIGAGSPSTPAGGALSPSNAPFDKTADRVVDEGGERAREAPRSESSESTHLALGQGERSLGPTQTIASPEEGEGAIRGTLGFGTEDDAQGETPPPRRPSYTPPPVSSRASLALSPKAASTPPVRRRWGAAGWAVVTAVLSFSVALGVSRFLGPSRAEEARKEQATAGPAQSETPTGLGAEKDTGNGTDERDLGSSDKAAVISVPPASGPGEKASQSQDGDSARGGPQIPAESVASKPVAAAPVAPTAVAPTPKSPAPSPSQRQAPAPSAAQSPEKAPGTALPGSGLW